MERGTRQILNSKSVKNILQMGAPAIRDGAEGDERISKVSDGVRLYRKALGQWWYVKLSNNKNSATIPIATSILLGGIKVGTGLSVTTDGVLSSTGSGANYYLDGITKSTNTLTFSVSGGVEYDQTYVFGSNAFTSFSEYSHPNHSGDVTSSGDGATAIASGVIIDDDVKSDASIAYSKLGSIPTWNQSTTGNANTVTTNANLTGAVTSVGNATSITAFASNTLADATDRKGIFKELSTQSLKFYVLEGTGGISITKNDGLGLANDKITISSSGFTTLAYKKIIAQTATGSDPDNSLFILADQAEDTLTIGGGTTGVTTNAVFSTDTIEINVSKDDLFNLSSVGLVKRTGTNTYAIDASSYLTGITKSQVEAVLTGSISSHTHSYDNYGDWNLWVNGSAVKDVTSTNNVKFEAGQGISLAYGSDAVTITSSSIFNGLADPNADKIPYWNDSTGIGGWITLDSSLSLSGSTLSASLSSVNRFVSVVDDGVTAYTAEDVDNQIKISGGSGINSSASQAGAVVTVILTADFGTGSTQVMAGNTLSAQDKTDIGNLSNTNSGDVCTSNHTSAGYSTGAHLAIGTSGGTALEGDTIVTNWSGASSGLTPATGRTSLELGTMAQQNTGSYATGAHLAIGTTSSTALAGNTAYSTLALGGSSSNAHRGDLGAIAYTHSQSSHLATSTDSQQDIGVQTLHWNYGNLWIRSDPRHNEPSYESNLVMLHMYTSTSTGANYGQMGLALYNNTAYQYFHTKGNTVGLFHNNSLIMTASNISSYANLYSLPGTVIHESELSNAIDSTSTTTGANVYGVKRAYDRAWAEVDHAHNYLPLAGGTMSDDIHFSNYGEGIVGVYSATKYQAVFAMGNAYKIANDGSGAGSLYGIAWTHTNNGGQSKSGLEHQALFMLNGVTQSAIGTGIWTNGTVTWPSGSSINANTAYTHSQATHISTDVDSQQTIGIQNGRWNYGAFWIQSDPRHNEGGYEANLINLHMYASTSAGGNYGQMGFALYNGSAYQYLHTKTGVSNLHVNNNQILHAGNYAGYTDFSGQVTTTYSTSMSPRYDCAFYVLQSQHWYGHSGSQDMYLGESGNNILVRGTISCSNDVVAFYSDARLKDFHGTIQSPLDKVMKLNGYYWTENEKAKELGYNNDRMQVGVSAQEIEEVLPELIKDAPIGHGYKTIDYSKLTPLLIEAIKELKTEINQLKGINNG